MSLDWSRSDSLALGISALASLSGIALWPQLPAEVAVHFSGSGTPDNYVSKAIGVALLPAIMLATLLVLNVSTASSSARSSSERCWWGIRSGARGSRSDEPRRLIPVAVTN
ncbi:hypothetical protein BRC96_10320 [Halobacteriales archaeon QS_6_64_34]|nr:MAG: hypothetical protein BRC96_10320 [Halobacteriales archaeon QS_6_64_34]